MTQETEARSGIGLFSSTTIKQFGNTLLDLFFPQSCVHCGRVDTGFCETCHTGLLQVPIIDYTTRTESGIVVASTAEHHGVIQSAIQALKYHNQRQLGISLGRRVATALSDLNWTIDTIIPVPLHTDRYRERGYNQAQEIATPIAETLQIPCEPQAIERTRITHSQVGLNRRSAYPISLMLLPHMLKLSRAKQYCWLMMYRRLAQRFRCVRRRRCRREQPEFMVLL